MSREIPLSRGFVALVDDADFELVYGWKWYCLRVQHLCYAVRNATAAEKKCGMPGVVLMHRVIVRAGHGDRVDHRNFLGTDNRRENLRTCTVAQNNAHARHRVGASGFRGVKRHRQKWAASISEGNRDQHIGTFTTPEAAAIAYDARAVAAFGEFAILNFER